MKYLSKLFMASVLLFQVHCATTAGRYENQEKSLIKVCDKMIESSGFKKGSSLEAKRQYNQCLLSQFKKNENTRADIRGLLTGSILNILVVLSRIKVL